MGTLDGFYLNAHRSQYAADSDAYTRSAGCTPTSLANGIDAATEGKISRSGDSVMSLIPRAQEFNPSVPGWNLIDADRAAAKIGVPFDVRSGQGWSSVVAAHDAGLYVVLQGDSDRFADATCSGAFNGDHCIGVHPADNAGLWWIDDPICKGGRYESPDVLRAYASKLAPGINFGVLTTPVRSYWPEQLGPKPAKATMWVETDELQRLFKPDGRGVLRPYDAGPPPQFQFTAWAGPNDMRTWAPGPASQVYARAVFREVLGPPHRGSWIRVTDQGSTWHHL